MDDDMDTLFKGVPNALFASAIPSKRDPSRLLPQIVAHRGYKAAWPENSLKGMREAIHAGAHAIETDVHLSKDGVVVMSHDPSLRRCFGVNKKIADCDWEYIAALRSKRPPHLGMPRLEDVLRLLGEDGMERVWCVLDIKIDDNAEKLLSAMSKVLGSVQGPVPWEQRILLGCWNYGDKATFITTARRILPTFPLTHISWSRAYSRQFSASIPNLGYSLHYSNLSGPFGRRFLEQTRHQHPTMPIFTWTVNQENWMQWVLNQNRVTARQPARGGISSRRLMDAVITDDPRKFREACATWEDELDGKLATGKKKGGLAAHIRRGWDDLLEMAKFTVLWVVLFVARRATKRLDTLQDVSRGRMKLE
ncbi:hypothetical protein NQ176_g9909 [Zarea fungicola]|uniref:Uncharacterized protein n=1 Tax=Zarea fungicola TaxID=93591 RepID=A0ACC1MKX6_9HYPO|nr:hypothetical protein NQ176_g9909 [Lecanicillium fungicola]